jgi:hypothetical protein
LADSIYGNGCSDATLCIIKDEIIVDFDREAPTYQIALVSAIMDIESTGLGLELVRVEQNV